MPRFRYTATNEKGKTVRGLLEAPSEEALYAKLRNDGLYMTDAQEAQKALATFRPLKTAVLADFCRNLGTLLTAGVPMFLLCLVIDGAFGGGDIKLMAAAGLFLGWQNTLLAMFFGIVFGGIYGIYLLAAKKAGKKDHFAFGPFLCAGIVIAMLFGGPVLEWYCAFL